MKLKRVITIFNKSGDEEMVKEIELTNIDLDELRSIFNVDADNPMYDCYPISEEIVSYFADKYGIDFDHSKYEYFVECYQED